MKQYLEYTRSPWCSYLFCLPLLVVYQVTLFVANVGHGHAIVNGADAIIQWSLNLVGFHGLLASWLVLAAVAGVLVYRLDGAHRKEGSPFTKFLPFLIETSAYGLVFGVVVSYLTSLVLPGVAYLGMGEAHSVSTMQRLAVGLGAGLYEELVFRLLLTGGLMRLFYAIGMKQGAATFFAVLLSSFVFSFSHYVGPLGDAFNLATFTFRMVAGIVLAVLFAVRGFAVAAWTHSLYDTFLLILGHG